MGWGCEGERGVEGGRLHCRCVEEIGDTEVTGAPSAFLLLIIV